MIDYGKLRRFIKVNKYVTTENYIKISGTGIVLKVMIVEADCLLDIILNLITAVYLGKVLGKIIFRNSVYPGFRIKPCCAVMSDFREISEAVI